MRQPCLQCFRKHLGNAQVLLEECADGYPYFMGVIGHLDQAAQEIRAYSVKLAKLVRAHRIKMQLMDDWTDYPFPFEALDRFISVLESLTDIERDFPQIPEDCYDGLEKNAAGEWELYEGDQR